MTCLTSERVIPAVYTRQQKTACWRICRYDVGHYRKGSYPMSFPEQWDSLKQERRQDADREMAATKDQTRKDSIRTDLTSFARLPVPTSDYEMNQRRSLVIEYRTAWANAGKDSRVQGAIFGRINDRTARK